MAKWTLEQYIYQLRRRLDEYDEDLYSTEELSAYINEGIQKMAPDLKKQAVRTLAIIDKAVIDYRELFVADSELLKPTLTDRDHNFHGMRSLYLDDVKLPLRTMEQIEAGEEGFYLWGDTINFDKAKSGNVRVYYFKRPSYLRNLTDTCDVPERFQDIPLEYAIAKAKQKDGEYGLYDYSLNQFMMMKSEMKNIIDSEETGTGVSELNITDYYE